MIEFAANKPALRTGTLTVLENLLEPSKKPTVVVDDVVVRMDYTLRVDGEIIDSSDDEGPLEFLQGHGNIIKGLEATLYGLKEGDQKHVHVPAADGYGEYDPEAIVDVPRSEFPPEIPLKPEVELEVADEDGDVQYAKIVSLTKSHVKLDFNHPLAGKTLEFDVTINELRAATPEELDHGHVHGHGHGHGPGDKFDYEDDEDEFDDDELVYEDEFDEFDDEDDEDFELDFYDEDDDVDEMDEDER